MKRLTLTLALLLGSALAAPLARADDYSIGKDLHLNVGYKAWLNSWQTTIQSNSAQGGDHFTAITKGGYGNIPNLSLRYKNFFVTGGFLASGNYNFPNYTDVIGVPAAVGGASKLETVTTTASRTEVDLNTGYMVIPQLGFTLGYKNVSQKYLITLTSPGVTYGSLNGTTTNTYFNGVTFGVLGSAPIGSGFSVYGNGVGGFMVVSYNPASTVTDTANYAASELGVAWHAEQLPLSFSLGYKYQILSTKPSTSNSPGLGGMVGNDVTQGYMLGAALTF